MALTRSFGAVETGLPGVKVTELVTNFLTNEPGYGAIVILGDLKRGPMGTPIPCNSFSEYLDIFGKPGDKNWPLFKDSASLAPDAIEGFFATSGDRSTVWVLRNELDGLGTKAEVTLLSRSTKVPVLKVSAANEGRWGGYYKKLDYSSLIVVTDRTFTLVAPGTKVNEYLGATATFSSGTAKEYTIVANTAADPSSGEVIFTVSSQYNLISDGLSGPTVLSGNVTYSRYASLTGTIAAPQFTSLTGTVTSNEAVLTGSNTEFSTELAVGDVVYFNGEPRLVSSITSDTTLTLEEAFTSPLAGDTLEKPNLTVTGTGTAFDTELASGDILRVTVGANTYERTVDTISSATELTLTSSFPEEVTAGTAAETYNYIVEDDSSGTDFDNDLDVGDFVIDPNRAGSAVKVVAIDTGAFPPQFTIEEQFSGDFTSAKIAKQTANAQVELLPALTEGLSVEIGQGVTFPDTHFSMAVYFEGEEVFNAGDLSLDPEDRYFVETEVNNRNLAYANLNKWITVESLYAGAYTTASDNDVRPAVSYSTILAVEPTRIYTAEVFGDRDTVVGRLIYPDPYMLPRDSYRIQGYVAPVTGDGTFASSGATVTGTATTFTSDFAVGDYLYDSGSGEARKVINVANDTSMELEAGFTSNVAAATPVKAGYFVFNQGIGIDSAAVVGNQYLADIQQVLVGGYDGDRSNILPYYWTRYFDPDINLIETAIAGKRQGLVRIAVPGVDDPSVARAGYTYADRTSLEYRAEIPSYIVKASVAEAYAQQQLGRSDFLTVAFPSYMNINNPFSRGTRLVPNIGDIMGHEARLASSAQGYHRIGAGNEAALTRAVSLTVDLNNRDIALLNRAGIQPIKPSQGTYIVFGNNCPSQNLIYQKIHVRRIQSHYTRTFLEFSAFIDQIFKPTTEAALREILMALTAFFREEYTKGVLTSLLTIDNTYNVNVPLIEAAGRSKKDVVTSIVNGKFQVYASYLVTGITENLEIFSAPDLATEAFTEQV